MLRRTAVSMALCRSALNLSLGRQAAAVAHSVPLGRSTSFAMPVMLCAARSASHSGLSNAAAHELQEEQSRSDKRGQPQPPQGWAVHHVPGSNKFVLRKSYQDETLEVRCSLPDTNVVSSPEAQQGSDNASNVTLIVQKGAEAMRFGLSIEDQELVLETVAHFKDGAIPKDESPVGEAKRRSMYAGPMIGELDSNFVDQLLSYMDERGVTDELAVFITEFAFWKEQQEYENWLDAVATFTR